MLKVAVVTGASKGIGLAVSEKLLSQGYQVLGVSRSAIGPRNKLFTPVKSDLSQITRIDRLVSLIPSRLDVLVNNAGLWFEKPVANVSLTDINIAFHLNFFAPVLLTQALLSRFRSGGVIINISSVMSIISEPGYSLYCASKSALDRFTTTLAKERPDLRVITVQPSGTATPGMLTSTSDPRGLLPAASIADVVWDAVSGKYPSGSLVAVINNRSRDWWATRDKYDLVIDLGKKRR